MARSPRAAASCANRAAIVVFPTPPFWFATATTTMRRVAASSGIGMLGTSPSPSSNHIGLSSRGVMFGRRCPASPLYHDEMDNGIMFLLKWRR